MNKRFLQKLHSFFSILDILILNLVLLQCKMYNSHQGWLSSPGNYMALVCTINISPLLLITKFGGHTINEAELFYRLIKRILRNNLLLVAFIGCLSLVCYEAVYSPFFILALASKLFVMLMVNRLVFVNIYGYFKRKTYSEDKVVFVGYNQVAMSVIEHMKQNGINKRIIGFCEDTANVNDLSPYHIISNITNAIDACKLYGATEIYAAVSPDTNIRVSEIIQAAEKNCITVKIIGQGGHSTVVRKHTEDYGYVSIFMHRNDPLHNIANRIAKRAFDIIFSGLVILFINSWLVPLVGLLIKLESKGPIFFKQLRSGKKNRLFYCYKFRSMHVNSDADNVQAVKNDSRVTRIGKFLRRTNLDEFPQFFNVFLGEMSITGPRPHMVKHTDQYSQLIDEYMVRHFVKPGITGWAQVNGYRGETKEVCEMRNRVEKDIWYMENWNFMLDVKIIFLTICNTIKGDKKAY